MSISAFKAGWIRRFNSDPVTFWVGLSFIGLTGLICLLDRFVS